MAGDRWQPEDMSYDPDTYALDLYVLALQVHRIEEKAGQALQVAVETRSPPAAQVATGHALREAHQLRLWLAGLGICRGS